MQLRNIGIFAHVDAGKTTLSEHLLMHAGAIRQAGSVDSGTAHTDSLPVEQKRGISVHASCVRLTWRDEERRTHFVLYDDVDSFREKVRLARAAGVRELFLPYGVLREELADFLEI